MEEHFTKWAKRFWFLRGVIAALTVLSLLEYLFGWPKWETVRFIQALLHSWKLTAKEIGDAIGLLPLVPKLTAEQVNAVILVLNVTLPGTIAASLPFIKETAEKARARNYFGAISSTAFPLCIATIFIISGSIFFELIKMDRIINPIIVEHGGLTLFGARYITVNLILVGTVVPFYLAFRAFKAYRHGVVYFVGALTVFQIIYYAPFLERHMKDYADGVLSADAQRGTE